MLDNDITMGDVTTSLKVGDLHEIIATIEGKNAPRRPPNKQAMIAVIADDRKMSAIILQIVRATDNLTGTKTERIREAFETLKGSNVISGFGKKKGKKTATPKQYKAGGKQRTAREKQLARLIKLL
jgi:hypothetical protein